MSQKYGIFLLMGFLSLLNIGKVAEAKILEDEAYATKTNLKVYKFKRENNKKEGTDNNLFSFEVGLDTKKFSELNRYLVILYIDGRYVFEYKNKKLPFTIKQNFSGLSSGTHEIRIDIEDGHDRVLSSEKVKVKVK